MQYVVPYISVLLWTSAAIYVVYGLSTSRNISPVMNFDDILFSVTFGLIIAASAL